jgi:hypothetical protein
VDSDTHDMASIPAHVCCVARNHILQDISLKQQVVSVSKDLL